MRKLILLVLLLTFALTGRSQLEVGIFGGGSYYMGDLNPNIPFLNQRCLWVTCEVQP
ncbi:MAG: hypothetical protein R2759_04275 [Bacteroidales bacterium]